MELNIYNSILFGDLKPWHQKNRNDKQYRQLITTQFMQPKNMAEFQTALQSVFKNDKALLRDETLEVYLKQPKGKKEKEISKPLVEIKIPTFTTTTTKFYYYLITNEATRLTDTLRKAVSCKIEDTDRKYLVNGLRTNIIDLLKKTTATIPHYTEDAISAYVLTVLKLSLVRLLIETEVLYPSYLNTPSTTETEIFAEYLGEPVPSEEYYKVSDTLSTIQEEATAYTAQEPEDRFSFGFNDNVEKLKAALSQLNSKIELLNEDQTTVDQLVSVFTSKNLTKKAPKVYFDCETVELRYVIVEKLKNYFSNLTPTTLEKSALFYSKKGTLLKAQNLYSSKVVNTKKKAIIDSIFKDWK